MKNNFVTTSLGLGIAILFAASLGLAKTKTMTKTIQILYPTEVSGGTPLKPGMYQVELLANSQSPEVGFYQNHTQIAEAPVKLVPSQTRNSVTEVQYDTIGNTHVIREIDFRGSNQRMVLEKPQPDK